MASSARPRTARTEARSRERGADAGAPRTRSPLPARRSPPVGPIVIALALLPALYLVWTGYRSLMGLSDALGANPIKEMEHRTGDWTLRFLVLTLAVTPLRQLTGWGWMQKQRRTLGLFTFGYGVLHLLCWVVLDNFFDTSDMVADIIKRPYITIGMASLLLMLPLAVTSTQRMLKRLGGQRWRRLHQLVYVIAVGGTLHFWMSLKKDKTEALIYAALFGLLFAMRLVRWAGRRRTAPA